MALSRQRIRELKRLAEALRALIDDGALTKRSEAPNPPFGALKPIELIERGQTDRLWQMIIELKAGTHV